MDISNVPIISITLATLAGGTVLTFVSGRWARWVALGTSILFLFEIALMFLGYQSWPGRSSSLVPQFGEYESYSWISLSWMQINYTVGIDGISLILILLTGFLQ